jgi:hypothetical protein
MPALRHKTCGHEWEVSQELADRVQHDLNGGVGGHSPPLTCPSCKTPGRYVRFEVVTETPPDA